MNKAHERWRKACTRECASGRRGQREGEETLYATTLTRTGPNNKALMRRLGGVSGGGQLSEGRRAQGQ